MGRKPIEKMTPAQCQSIVTWVHLSFSPLFLEIFFGIRHTVSNSIETMQAMPQLTDRSKLPNIIDPVIRNKMDLKHLYQVRNQRTYVMCCI